MQDAGEGIIVFVSSQAALIGIYGLAAYCGSKYAVRGFAEALAMEVKEKNYYRGMEKSPCCMGRYQNSGMLQCVLLCLSVCSKWDEIKILGCPILVKSRVVQGDPSPRLGPWLG